LRYYPGMFLEELNKTMQSVIQDSRSRGRDSNREPPKYMLEPAFRVITVAIQSALKKADIIKNKLYLFN
jgi:hypothetical protein